MRFEVGWLIILAVNLAVWALVGRCDRLRYVLDRAICFPRHVLERPSKQRSWIADKIKAAMLNMFRRDDDDLSGFAPPRTMRSIISAIVVLENATALSALGSDNVWKRLSARCGQLACLNVLPLALLAFPGAGLTLLVRQTRPQVLWAHHLFSWIVWYELLVHALMEALTLPAGMFALVAFGFGGLLLFCSTTCWAMDDWRTARGRIASLGHLPRHTIPGLGALVLATLHSRSTACRVVLGLAVTVVLASSVWQATRRSIRSIDVELKALPGGHFFKLKVPHSGETHLQFGREFYYLVDGIPCRAMWSGSRLPLTFSTVVLGKEKAADCKAMRVEGPYCMPQPPYCSWKGRLGFLCDDAGLSGALAAARTRKMLGNETGVVWFTDSAELARWNVKLLLKTAVERLPDKAKELFTMKIIFTGQENEDLTELVESAKNVSLIRYKPKSEESLIKDYVLCHHVDPLVVARKWVVVNESFRGRGARIDDRTGASWPIGLAEH